jgi:peptidoglycan-N-acetylmuramic acid deacetylase
MRRGSSGSARRGRAGAVRSVAAAAPAAVRGVAAIATAVAMATAVAGLSLPAAAAPCERPVYLTFDTGHMGVAPLVAEVLNRQQVKATFFLANEKTLTGGTSLDDAWAPWWKARAAEGHAFGSHTWDHVYWTGDRQGGGSFRVRPSAGPDAGKAADWTAARYCAELERPAERFRAMTGQPLTPAGGRALFRAPGGKTSPALIAAAAACGWSHVPWSAAGFLGDELPSEKVSNDALLRRALRDVRPGDILLAHLGIWSRKDAWAPAALEPLVAGLKAEGYCFATLRDHPLYGARTAAR